MHEVQAIVLALERRNSIFLECLDSLSLTILCSIFIYSQECLAQQRGLCLLAASWSTTYDPTMTDYAQKVLHRNEGDSVEKAAHKQQKKLAVGHAALTFLIRAFLRTDPSKKLRRWVRISYCPDDLLNFLPVWSTCFGTSQRMSQEHTEAAVRSA